MRHGGGVQTVIPFATANIWLSTTPHLPQNATEIVATVEEVDDVDLAKRPQLDTG